MFEKDIIKDGVDVSCFCFLTYFSLGELLHLKTNKNKRTSLLDTLLLLVKLNQLNKNNSDQLRKTK